MKKLNEAQSDLVAGGDNPGMGPYDAPPTSTPLSPVMCRGTGFYVDGKELQVCAQVVIQQI